MTLKKNCEECGMLIRSCKLSKNKLTGKLSCWRCNRKIGSNKFYTPSNKYQKITKFSITDDEKKVLRKNKSQKQINRLCEQLSNVRIIDKIKRNQEKEEKINREFKNTKTNKKFLEGLNGK